MTTLEDRNFDIIYAKNDRSEAYDFLGKPVYRGNYVSFPLGKSRVELGIVASISKKSVRIIWFNDYNGIQLSQQTTKPDKVITKVHSDDVPVETRKIFCEIENLITLPQKIKML